MWTDPPCILLLHSLRFRPLLLNTPQVSWYRHVNIIYRREGDEGMDTKLYGADHKPPRRQLTWRWHQHFSRKQIFFNNADQTAPGTTFSYQNFGALCPFLNYHTARDNHHDNGRIFPAVNPSWSLIKLGSLLHSCTQLLRPLFLHTPQGSDTVTSSSFSEGRAMDVSIINC